MEPSSSETRELAGQFHSQETWNGLSFLQVITDVIGVADARILLLCVKIKSP